MGVKILILISDLIIPVIMLLIGVKSRRHGPNNINTIYGYRTPMSIKNKSDNLYRKKKFFYILIWRLLALFV